MIILMRIQHVVAVEYGFSKWEELMKASADELQLAIKRARVGNITIYDLRSNKGTPLGNFIRGPGIIPTEPRREALVDMFDK